jgi:glycosyltransferase involved in cell wall biosynthesis
MYTFLALFRSYLDRIGIEHAEVLDDTFDVLFINSWVVPFSSVLKAKKRYPRLRVVQRIDGSATEYGRLDNSDRKQGKINLLADLTIFQSKYSQYITTQRHRIISNNGPVIYNPVDTDVFSPDGKKEDLAGRIKLAYVSYSTNPKKGAAMLYTIVKQNPDIDFYLAGRYDNPPVSANMHILGFMDKPRLAAVLRSCDALLFLSENEACSNVVLEALSCGLPVLYKDSGGTKELVEDCGSSVTENGFRAQLTTVLEKRSEFSTKARQRVLKNFSLDIILQGYLKAISSCRRRALLGLGGYIRWWLSHE